MIVFALEHLHIKDDGEEDAKFIGVFSSAEKAQEAIQQLRLQPSF